MLACVRAFVRACIFACVRVTVNVMRVSAALSGVRVFACKYLFKKIN